MPLPCSKFEGGVVGWIPCSGSVVWLARPQAVLCDQTGPQTGIVIRYATGYASLLARPFPRPSHRAEGRGISAVLCSGVGMETMLYFYAELLLGSLVKWSHRLCFAVGQVTGWAHCLGKLAGCVQQTGRSLGWVSKLPGSPCNLPGYAWSEARLTS